MSTLCPHCVHALSALCLHPICTLCVAADLLCAPCLHCVHTLCTMVHVHIGSTLCLHCVHTVSALCLSPLISCVQPFGKQSSKCQLWRAFGGQDAVNEMLSQSKHAWKVSNLVGLNGVQTVSRFTTNKKKMVDMWNVHVQRTARKLDGDRQAPHE